MKKTFTEEDLAEASGGEDDNLQPDKKAAKKRKKRGSNSRIEPQSEKDVDDAANSDEDLPEVFTMTEGKSMAQQLRSEERATGRRFAAEVKKKRKERAAGKKDDKTSSKSGVLLSEELTVDKVDADPEQSNVEGLLDDTIVRFLSAHEEAEMEERNTQYSLPIEVDKKKPSKSKKEKGNDRVQLIVLSRDSSFVEGHNGVDFKHDHLYGNRIKRDSSMLRKTTRVSCV